MVHMLLYTSKVVPCKDAYFCIILHVARASFVVISLYCVTLTSFSASADVLPLISVDRNTIHAK